jgi:uncharacterized protein YqeY
MPASDQPATPNPLEERLRADLRDAQRARDQVRIDTLRLALGAFHNEEVARTDPDHPQHRVPLDEQARIALLDKQIKQRQEAAQFYRTANRLEQAEKEEREAAILQAYMPTQLSDDEIRQIVTGLIAQHGKEFRAIMPLAARETKGRADGRRVQEIVREQTG